MTYREEQTLRKVKEGRGRVTSRNISNSLLWTTSSTLRLLKKLEREGLIEKTGSIQDGVNLSYTWGLKP